MAKADFIPPFPTDINRDAFGHWLSGFVDGEGHFSLSHSVDKRDGKPDTRVCFEIQLRADDSDVFQLIQSFWQCGSIQKPVRRTRDRGGHPITRYAVANIRACHDILLSHFDAYPLRSKKRLHYVIWKEAIQLAYIVHRRRVQSLGNRGTLPKWSPSEIQKFLTLRAGLKAQRVFGAPSIGIFDNMPR